MCVCFSVEKRLQTLVVRDRDTPEKQECAIIAQRLLPFLPPAAKTEGGASTAERCRPDVPWPLSISSPPPPNPQRAANPLPSSELLTPAIAPRPFLQHAHTHTQQARKERETHTQSLREIEKEATPPLLSAPLPNLSAPASWRARSLSSRARPSRWPWWRPRRPTFASTGTRA